jgi:hypothetical protein
MLTQGSGLAVRSQQCDNAQIARQNWRLMSMTANKSIFVECDCGHQLSGFRILNEIGKLVAGNPPDQTLIARLLPRMKFTKCGRRGQAQIVWKESAASRRIRFVATVQSGDKVFHRSTCGWMGNVQARNEIVFSTASEAVRLGYSPCRYCRPKE